MSADPSSSSSTNGPSSSPLSSNTNHQDPPDRPSASSTLSDQRIPSLDQPPLGSKSNNRVHFFPGIQQVLQDSSGIGPGGSSSQTGERTGTTVDDDEGGDNMTEGAASERVVYRGTKRKPRTSDESRQSQESVSETGKRKVKKLWRGFVGLGEKAIGDVRKAGENLKDVGNGFMGEVAGIFAPSSSNHSQSRDEYRKLQIQFPNDFEPTEILAAKEAAKERFISPEAFQHLFSQKPSRPIEKPVNYTQRQRLIFDQKMIEWRRGKGEGYEGWRCYGAALGLAEGEAWIDRDGLQANGSRKSWIPSAYPPRNEDSYSVLFLHMVTFWNKDEYGTFFHLAGSTVTTDYEDLDGRNDFETSRHKGITFEVETVLSFSARRQVLDQLEVLSDRFTGIDSSSGGRLSYFIAPDAVPRLHPHTSFANRLAFSVLSETFVVATPMAIEVAARLQRMAGAKDLQVMVDDIYEMYDLNLRISATRADLLYTLPTFRSGEWELCKSLDNTGDALADVIAMAGLLPYVIRRAWAGYGFRSGTIMRMHSSVTSNAQWCNVMIAHNLDRMGRQDSASLITASPHEEFLVRMDRDPDANFGHLDAKVFIADVMERLIKVTHNQLLDSSSREPNRLLYNFLRDVTAGPWNGMGQIDVLPIYQPLEIPELRLMLRNVSLEEQRLMEDTLAILGVTLTPRLGLIFRLAMGWVDGQAVLAREVKLAIAEGFTNAGAYMLKREGIRWIQVRAGIPLSHSAFLEVSSQLKIDLWSPRNRRPSAGQILLATSASRMGFENGSFEYLRYNECCSYTHGGETINGLDVFLLKVAGAIQAEATWSECAGGPMAVFDTLVNVSDSLQSIHQRYKVEKDR